MFLVLLVVGPQKGKMDDIFLMVLACYQPRVPNRATESRKRQNQEKRGPFSQKIELREQLANVDLES